MKKRPDALTRLQAQVLANIDTEMLNSTCKAVSEKLVAGLTVTDGEFDMIYPERIRRLSSLHWTSVKASLRASQLCVFKPGANVLDVGSGVGKFCLIGAIVTDGHFVGVEQREYFVDLATSLAKQLRLNRVEFQLNNIVQIDWSPFDSIYLYNPFYENIEPMIHIDEAVDLDPVLYDYYSKIVTGKLAELKVGTRVVILNGYGGTLPSSYELLSAEKMGRAILEAWVQTDGL